MGCNFEFSRGCGTGVAEAIGKWGFSNNKLSNSGQELERIRYLSEKMACLKTTKPMMCVKYDCRYDPEAWSVKPSPEECKPSWTVPMKRPLITYSSTAEIRFTSNLNSIGTDLLYVIPGRSYVVQGTDKWYRRGPDCCPQPSCLAPQCPRPCCY
ncbi:PREDICTED: uncharacterized protein LOC107188707 [Dufourea novaeangliae]|uniref:uncharacterized protein LOC107188707 n=1 Tax=Dufourea novaeangliae TaxID=178035 RepID=UPI00076739A0|nr:PREDICTED: uncharacterized protein LOC107188707 [Dufourea novaeangliae]